MTLLLCRVQSCQIHSNSQLNASCRELRGNGKEELSLNRNRLPVLKDEQALEEKLHGSVNTHNTTELRDGDDGKF